MSAAQLSRSAVMRRVLGATGVGLVLALAIGVGVIRFTTDVDPWPIFKAIRPGWLAAAVGMFVFANILVGHRFLAIAPVEYTREMKGFTVGSLFFAGSVFSLMLPGPVGEVAAVAALRQRYGIPMSVAFAASVHARFVGLASAACFALVAFPFVTVDGVVGQVVAGGGIILVLVGVGLGAVSTRPAWMMRLGKSVIAATDSLGSVGGSLRLFADALVSVGGAPWTAWLRVFGWSVCIQGFQVVSMILLCLALNIEAHLAGLMLSQGTGSLAILVGMFLPGGLGTFEVAVIGSMVGAGGVSVVDAGTFVVSLRIVHLLSLGISGVMFAAWANVFLSNDVVEELDNSASGREE